MRGGPPSADCKHYSVARPPTAGFGLESLQARCLVLPFDWNRVRNPPRPASNSRQEPIPLAEESMATKAIESVLQENRVFPPSPAFARQAAIPSMDAYRKLCAEAEKDFEGFWGKLARENLLCHKPFTRVLDETKAPFFKWFYDGELNASYNCLDRHLKTQPDKV